MRVGRWQIGWQGPRLGAVAETGSFVLLVALLPSFLFLRHNPGIFSSVNSVASSVQHSSDPLQQARCSPCVIFIISRLRTPLVLFALLFVILVFLVGVFVVLSYPVRCHSICRPWFVRDYYLEFLCLSLWPQNWYLSRMKNRDGRWVHCWCRWVEITI